MPYFILIKIIGRQTHGTKRYFHIDSQIGCGGIYRFLSSKSKDCEPRQKNMLFR